MGTNILTSSRIQHVLHGRVEKGGNASKGTEGLGLLFGKSCLFIFATFNLVYKTIECQNIHCEISVKYILQCIGELQCTLTEIKI